MYNEEIIKLVLDIQNTKDPAEIAAKFDTLKGKLLETSKAFIELDQYCDAAVTSLGKAQVASDKQTAAAVEATRAGKFYAEVFDEMAENAAFVSTEVAGLTSSMDQLKGQGGSGGFGILGVSYAVQDFTSVMAGGGGFGRAIGSIQNNIPGVLMALGMGTGLAGAISLITVGLGSAIPLLGLFAGKEKEVEDAAKEATKAIERQKAASDALTGKPSPSQAETAAGVTEYIGLVGGENIRQGIEASIAATSPGEGLTVAERQLLADYEHAQVGKGGIGDRMFPGLLQDKLRLEKKRSDAITARSHAIMGDLPTVRDARETVRRMQTARPEDFPGLRGLAGDLQSFEPEDQAMADARMQVAEEEGAAAHDAGVKRRQKAHEANELEARRKRMEKNLDRATNEAIRNETSIEQQNIRDANAMERANREKDRAETKAKRDTEQTPAVVNRAQKVIQDTKDLMQRQAVEREINQRSGGQNSYKDIQEAAKRTLDLTARGVGINDALIIAMREQGAKINALNAHITGQDEAIKEMRMQMRNGQAARIRRVPPSH